MELKGSKTETSLKEAFAGESQANRRYLYFAAKADVEGYNDVAAVRITSYNVCYTKLLRVDTGSRSCPRGARSGPTASRRASCAAP